jgi:beta-glucosidase
MFRCGVVLSRRFVFPTFRGLLSFGVLAFLSIQPPARASDTSADPALEQKVSAILKQMTLEEKIGLCSGGKGDAFRGVERLHIPPLRYTDGPRGPHRGGADCTTFPTGVCIGATWDPQLVYEAGQVMGSETRAQGCGMLLGPGLNIQRDPLGGRFFEYYTEDPYLNGQIITASVDGIQSEQVAACLKHFICNNREDNRNNYMSMVDPQPLNEIYMPGFKAAVQQGHAWAVMTSANGVNGDFVSDSKALLNDKLKGEWGFDGVVLTDWLQTRSTEKAALAGLDISMPGGAKCGFAQPLLDAVKAGKIPESVIDDKARRVLRLYGRVGTLDGRDITKGAETNTSAHQAVARQAAAGGIVLLKNANALLPLDPTQVKKVLVVGPAADKRFCLIGLGGSSWAQSPYEVTVLDGLKTALGDRVYFFSSDDLGGFAPVPNEVMQPINGVKGFQVQYTQQGDTKPAIGTVVPDVNFMWEMRTPDPRIKTDLFKAHFAGHIIPPMDGLYTLRVITGGSVWLHGIDQGSPIAIADTSQGRSDVSAVVVMKKGIPFPITLDYTRQPGDASIRLEWQLPTPSQTQWNKLDDAARSADAIVFVGGIDQTLDTEGRDRSSLEFPTAQTALLHRLVQANPKTIAVLLNGSPLEIGGWLPEIPAVVEAWYPGMEGGNAVADVLLGKIDPSGRLPFSWPKKLSDSPSHAIGTEDNDHVYYKEGVFVGYRYFDSMSVEPQFPFGYGLSYTTFDFGRLTLIRSGNKVDGKLTVTNSGNRNGIETVQIYVHPIKPSINRPIHELKAFRKLIVAPGQSREMEFTLEPDAFSYFDPQANQWRMDPGEYEIQAGASSADIRSKALIEVTR